jgi:selenium metabolism protein YedF
MEKQLDCRGLACPHPVLRTKKALEEPGVTAVVTLVDNETARENVSLFAQSAGFGHEVRAEEGGLWEIRVFRPGLPGPDQASQTDAKGQTRTTDPEEAAVAGGLRRGCVYLVTSNQFGQGSPELGDVLMKSLFVSLAEGQPPQCLVFLNTGVYLAAAGSAVLPQLEKLAGAGTEILSCGTCLEYYRLKEKLAVGRVTNMLEIRERLDAAAKVVTVA